MGSFEGIEFVRNLTLVTADLSRKKSTIFYDSKYRRNIDYGS